ncbi:hypothetical protein J3R83DRAFT_727 [Lanmaoa asiatica]|nr:hypothetical protein J3R83DRAFT_727 [Lanmaoa asiatica]
MSKNFTTTSNLNYSLKSLGGSRAYTHINANSITGQHRHNRVEDPRVVNNQNVRGSDDQHTLDIAGFQYGKVASMHTRFLGNKNIAEEC